ncbi:hypothetical protein EVAR_94151_1 [Eumeta japonica]|uniref:Uncharacterized protein n=1 Tax=Eumeta variegata TaxID=151549 RepID=A0A4C1U712_EUMVA|nr:hypothetical protein EVAR_94151_1 [Eumeta japonica]
MVNAPLVKYEPSTIWLQGDALKHEPCQIFGGPETYFTRRYAVHHNRGVVARPRRSLPYLFSSVRPSVRVYVRTAGALVCGSRARLARDVTGISELLSPPVAVSLPLSLRRPPFPPTPGYPLPPRPGPPCCSTNFRRFFFPGIFSKSF